VWGVSTWRLQLGQRIKLSGPVHAWLAAQYDAQLGACCSLTQKDAQEVLASTAWQHPSAQNIQSLPRAAGAGLWGWREGRGDWRTHPEEVAGVVVLGPEAREAEVGARLLVGPGLGKRHAAEVGDRRRAARRVARVRRVQGIPRAGDDERQVQDGAGGHGRAVPRCRRHVVVEHAVRCVVGVVVQSQALLLLDAGRLRRHAGAGSPPLDGQVRGALHRRRTPVNEGMLSCGTLTLAWQVLRRSTTAMCVCCE